MEAVFADGGVLAGALEGYAFRKAQLEMAQMVAETFGKQRIALVEAGTGTGKSLAYLVPALLTGGRTVISTHTINLQEQLVHKDIPALLKAICPDAHAVLVKGMANYLCIRRLADAPGDAQIRDIRDWAQETKEGSRSDMPFFANHETWDKVNAEADSCTHARCPHYKDCHFFQARKRAEKADILVVNHHLLMADLRARAEDGQLLPDYDHLVIDEAHHLEDVATEALAWRLSRRQMVRWLEQLVSLGGGKLQQLRKRLGECDHQPITLALESDLPMGKNSLVAAINEAFHVLGQLSAGDELRFRVTESSREKVRTDEVDRLIEELKRFVAALQGLGRSLEERVDTAILQKTEGLRQEVSAVAMRLEKAACGLEHFAHEVVNPGEVRWIELNARGTNVQLVGARLDVSEMLQEQLFATVSATVLTSATLTTGRSFEFYKRRLGLVNLEVTEASFASPFDYQQQAQLLIANDLPLPSHPQFIDQAAKVIERMIHACGGNAFVLFTSYTMLRRCAQVLERSGLRILSQGDQGRAQLLEEFRQTQGAVLFGTDSFWEGVDVVGDALQCVILTKLPFKVPTEPLVEARLQAIEEAGGNSFFEYSLPQAVVKFKQGFGRLIRSQSDSGSIVCLDQRLVTKSYGREFTKSLPSCPITTGPASSLVFHLATLAHRSEI